jgi:hypothetical protein
VVDVRIEHDCDPLKTWRDLREQLKPLTSQRGLEVGETRDVPTRAVEPHNEAAGLAGGITSNLMTVGWVISAVYLTPGMCGKPTFSGVGPTRVPSLRDGYLLDGGKVPAVTQLSNATRSARTGGPALSGLVGYEHVLVRADLSLASA